MLVVEGADIEEIKAAKENEFANMSVKEHYEMYLGQGMSDKDAMKQVAKDRNIPKRDVYSEVKI